MSTLFENWATDWIWTTPVPFTEAAGDSWVTAFWTHLTTHLSERTLLIYLTMAWSTLGYVLLYTPFAIMERIPFFDQWKIQPDKKQSAAEYRDLYVTLVLSYVFVIYPSIWLAYPLFDFVGVSLKAEDIPDLVTFLWQIAVCFLIEDTWHFFAHWGFHKYKFLYNNIHIVHHRWSAPIGLAAQYAHPLEILGLGVGTFLGVVVLQLHCLTMWCWITLRQMEAVVVHSGYDFPFSPEYWLPWYAGVRFHDLHHSYNRENYASTGLFWDSVFGTNKKWLKEVEKRRLAKEKKA